MNDIIVNILSVLYVIFLPAYIAKKLSDNHNKSFIKSYFKPSFISVIFPTPPEIIKGTSDFADTNSAKEISKPFPVPSWLIELI